MKIAINSLMLYSDELLKSLDRAKTESVRSKDPETLQVPIKDLEGKLHGIRDLLLKADTGDQLIDLFNRLLAAEGTLSAVKGTVRHESLHRIAEAIKENDELALHVLDVATGRRSRS